jgi:ABC-2 type transport system permease protein
VIPQLRAEVAKFTSVRIGFILIIATVGYVGLSTAAQVAFSDIPGLSGLQTESAVRGIFASAGAGLIFALVSGILGMTAEYRHQTITSTLLITPKRERVVVAKTLAAVGLGFVVGLAAAVTSVGVGLVALTFRSHATIPVHSVLTTLAGVMAAYVCYAVLGTAIGTLITNQVAAITGALLWVMLVEPLLGAFLPKVGRWLPGGAASGLAQATGLRGTGYLAPTAAAAVLLGYTVMLAAIATRTTLRRDIT